MGVEMKAFPVWADGMDLRDWFASMALQGIVANEGVGGDEHIKGIARVCYEIADAMMKAREEQNNG
jgi:hypothetical protein